MNRPVSVLDVVFCGFNSAFLFLQTNGNWQEQNTPPSAASPGSDHSDNSDWWTPGQTDRRKNDGHSSTHLQFQFFLFVFYFCYYYYYYWTSHWASFMKHKQWKSIFYKNCHVPFNVIIYIRMGLIHKTWAEWILFIKSIQYVNTHTHTHTVYLFSFCFMNKAVSPFGWMSVFELDEIMAFSILF